MAMTGAPSPNFQFSLGSIGKIVTVVTPLAGSLGFMIALAVYGGSYRTSIDDHLSRTDDTVARLASAIVAAQTDVSQLAKAVQESQREMAVALEKFSSTDKQLTALSNSVGRIEDKLDGVPAASARQRGGN